MKKAIRTICLVMIAILAIGSFTGCTESGDVISLTIGLPFDTTDPDKGKILQEIIDDFCATDDFKLTVIKIPEDEAGRRDFLKKVDNGTVSMFYYERDELINSYIEKKKVASLLDLQEKIPALLENKEQYILDISVDDNGMNQMLPVLGEYQGIFVNTELFEKNNIPVPKTWDDFIATIESFKQLGITPIAAGFEDQMDYWIDELILMEGGVAEHSYVPKNGLVSSWSRAAGDLRSLYNMGTFNADCLTATHEQALQSFIDKKAAMILTNSEDLEKIPDYENLRFFTLPITATGKKNYCDFIGKYTEGFYFNNRILSKKREYYEAVIELFTMYFSNEDLLLDFGEQDTFEDIRNEIDYQTSYSYNLFKKPWSMSANTIMMGFTEKVVDPVTGETIPFHQRPVDFTAKPINPEEDLQESVYQMMMHAKEAGTTMRQRYLTFDNIVAAFKNIIASPASDINAQLDEATKGEIAAQAAKNAVE